MGRYRCPRLIVNPKQEGVAPSGKKPIVTPRPMSKDEIRQTVADFGTAARNALEAGFDGVQIQANFLYLIAQFLNSGTNLRKDEYGGSTVNRARFLFEIIETVLEFVGIGPSRYQDRADEYIGAFRC
jgi:N-ethylmaleimide reductase